MNSWGEKNIEEVNYKKKNEIFNLILTVNSCISIFGTASMSIMYNYVKFATE